MKKFIIVTAGLFLLSIFLLNFADIRENPADDPALAAPQAGKHAYDKDTVIVKFAKGTDNPERKQIVKLLDGKVKDKNDDGIDDRYGSILNGRLTLIELKGSKSEDKAAKAVKKLEKHSQVEYAELNYIQYAQLTPNDPRYSELWAMNNTGQTGGTADADIDAPEAWDTTTGSSDVIIGVIDTGVDYNHQDLAANMWTNPNEIAGNGIDDDGNGYVDDVYGINAITGSGNPMDDHYHGTHCSGTVGAVGNNGVGVVGVCWTARLIGMKFLNSGGSGTTADAIECVNYAVWLKNNGTNIRVLSNSWGGGGFDQSLEDAISAANNVGILFVAAAGNSSTNNDTSPHYPSSYEVPNVLAVASTDHNDNLSSFSNYGATSVDLGAPGSSILSTFPNNSYSSISGTSMATPHVSGAAGLLLSINGNLTVAELKSILMDSGDPLSALSGRTVSGKRLNVKNAVDAVQPPAPGFDLSADPTSREINQGQSTTYTINIASIMGFSGNVDLDASANPSLNATITFDPNPAAVDSSSVMTVETTTATAVGTYNITVTGTSGAVTDTTSVTLKVNPEGTIIVSYTNNTPVSIPDNDPTGVTSTIDVPDSLTISATSVEVHITHTYIGDLIVKLTSPLGTEVTLHDRSGGSADNLYQTYDVPDYNGENSLGTWTLFVSDNAGIDVGTLDYWTLTITGVGGAPQPPTADFSGNPTTVIAGGSVDFTDLSTGNPTSWSWTFAGGTPGTSSQQNPTITYNTPGTYDVSLTATNAGGSDTETKVGYITVTALQPPVADFTASATTIQAGQSVTFTDTSTGNPDSWSWTFEGGTPGTSTSQNPTITYNTPGVYDVSLTATNGAGSDTETKVDYITVQEAPINYCTSSGNNQNYEYIAGVQVEDLNNPSGSSGYTDFTSLTAHLTAGTSASVSLTPGFVSSSYTEWWKIWIDYNIDGDFEDAGEEVFAGSGSSTVNGSFNVPADADGITRMRVSMSYSTYPPMCGTFTYGEVEDYTVDIQGAVPQPPVAAFTASTTTVVVGGSVTFTDQSTNNPTSWSWTFEGGTPSSSTTQNPTVQYNSEGTFDVSLTATNAVGSDTETKIDYITVTAVPADEIAEAVDNAALTFTHSGNADWARVTDVYYYDGDSAESGDIGNNQSSTIETEVTVGSTQSVKFYWKVSSEANYDYLRFYIDGVEKTQIAGNVDWTQVSYNIAAGTHTLKWSYTKDYSVSSGSDCGWVDKVEIGAPAADPIAEAVDYPSLTFSLSGNANWFSQTTTTYYGGDAAQSGDIGNNQTTTMETTISGVTSVKFYWKVSSETNYDYLRFYIDGVEQNRISGNVDWTQRTYSVSSGTHTLKWSFTKDYSVSSGSDCGWVDKLELQ